MASKTLKPWQLDEDVTFSSYSKWQSTMQYCLNKEEDWKRFLKPLKPTNKDTSWAPLTANNPTRSLEADENGMDAETKALHLNNMLEYIAQFVPVFLHHEITHECTDMRSVWNCVRQYYNLQQSEANFLKLATIKWEGPDKERPERLYRRVLSHLTDNLLKASGSLQHNKSVPTRDEDISPTVERLAVLRWLELIDSRLPMLVARTFATDLQTRTLKDLQPQIANAMDSLLEQLRSEDTQICRLQSLTLDEAQVARVTRPRQPHTRSTPKPRPAQGQSRFSPNTRHNSNPRRLFCNYCHGWNRNPQGHSMATCRYISEADKHDLAQSVSHTYHVGTQEYEEEACHPQDNDDQE